MKVVIDIPKVYYDALKQANVIVKGQRSGKTLESVIYNAVGNGVPLPEHHGRLIDADVLVDGMEDDYEFCEAVNATPTIIPATGKEFFNFDAPIIKKQTATKEGDGE